jgi:hypothetical protein
VRAKAGPDGKIYLDAPAVAFATAIDWQNQLRG